MNDLLSLIKKDLTNLIENLFNDDVIRNNISNKLTIDYNSKSKQGDLSSNLLFILKGQILNKSFNINEYVENYLSNLEYIETINIHKAGFVNIILTKDYISNYLNKIYILENIYTKTDKQKINLEFVSANPTGPIHIAHLRGAVLGDVLSSILERIGHEVTREYYVNDAGSQITILGNSLFKRYQELCGKNIQFLDGEYPGNYLIEIAKEIKNSDNEKWLSVKDSNEVQSYFEQYAVKYLIKKIKDDLLLLNIKFDQFTLESEIVKNNLIDKVFSILKDKNLIYEGILEKPLTVDTEDWEPRKQLLFRSTTFSDDNDRAFKKSNGEWTYFANDAAYHFDKYKRGYDKLINIWGADHIGYIKRMVSIVDVFSNKQNYLKVIVCQIVRLFKDNQLLKISKREGNFITLEEIYKQVGKDPLRYFMISTKNETPMDFYMDKVVEKNKDNPVFYCQYAYARASSVINNANKLSNIDISKISFTDFDKLSISKFEWEIILKLISWPYILQEAALTMQPHKLTNYLEDLCSNFHAFWNKGKDDSSLRMLDENNITSTISRIIWIQSFRNILKEVFTIIDISFPENM